MSIECRDIVKLFGKHLILNELNWKVATPGVHALIGKNGAGKTTLLQILTGMLGANQGAATLYGYPCVRIPANVIQKLAYVNDEHHLPAHMNISDLANYQATCFKAWDSSLFKEICAHFELSQKQKPQHLSRGQRAGLALALVLPRNPEILLLDEPTLGIDPSAKQKIIDTLLFSSTLEDKIVVYCSHQIEEVARVADTISILENGQTTQPVEPDVFQARFQVWYGELANGAPLPPLPGLINEKQLDDQFRQFIFLDHPQTYCMLQTLRIKNMREGQLNLHSAVVAYLQRKPSATHTNNQMVPLC